MLEWDRYRISCRFFAFSANRRHQGKCAGCAREFDRHFGAGPLAPGAWGDFRTRTLRQSEIGSGFRLTYDSGNRQQPLHEHKFTSSGRLAREKSVYLEILLVYGELDPGPA
jgi:hypothetical protein